jgi:hypothetical protein
VVLLLTVFEDTELKIINAARRAEVSIVIQCNIGTDLFPDQGSQPVLG